MKSPLKTAKILVMACVVSAAEVAVGMAGGVVSMIAFSAIGVIAALTIGFLCTRHKANNPFDRHKKGSILLATAAGCVFLVACCFEPSLAAVSDLVAQRFAGADLFSYYTAQLSLTFISISVMSVLSDKSVIIYWANVSEDRLIKPMFSCFAAYTYYSLGATIGAGLGVILNDPFMFGLFFAVNVGVLILLTVSMIDVYYGRDTKKKKLAKTLVPDPAHKTAYENKILGLEQNMLRAADEKDMAFLQEVFELYMAHPEKFHFYIGCEAVDVMVSTLDTQIVGPFLRVLHYSQQERLNRLPSVETLLATGSIPPSYMWKEYDTDLWFALASDQATPIIESLSSPSEDGLSSSNAILFLRAIVQRLTLEYNFYASHYILYRQKDGTPVDPALYFVQDHDADAFINAIYLPKTADGMPLPYERYKEVLDRVKWLVFPYDPVLHAAMVRIVGRLVMNGVNWITAKYLTALPYVTYWMEEDGIHDAAAMERLAAVWEDVNRLSKT